jgi:hypothetical protein
MAVVEHGQPRRSVHGEKDFHPGLDISADKGDPVYATADGKVVNASAAGNYGNLVILDHGYGLETRYGHLSAFKVKSARRSSAATCWAWSARPAAPPARTSITRSGPTAASSIRCSCSSIPAAPRELSLARKSV